MKVKKKVANSKQTKEKLKQLIVYITEYCLDEPDFNIEKLKAILFKSDFESFGKTGKPITGAKYIKTAVANKFEIEPENFIRLARESYSERLRELSESDLCGYGVRYYSPEWNDHSWLIHRVYPKSISGEDDSFCRAKLACDILRLKHPHLTVEIFELLQGGGYIKDDSE